MSRAKIAYDFAPVTRKRDPRWKNLRNVYGRHLFAELFLLTEGKPYAFAGEWDVFLCRELCIPGPQRTNFCRAFQELKEVGLLTVSETHLHVVFNEQVGCRSGAGAEQVESSPRAATVQVVSSLDSSPRNDLMSIRQTEETDRREERENARPRAHTRDSKFERPPVPEKPADVPDAEPPLAHTIVQAHAAEYGTRMAGVKPPSDYGAAKQLADWCESSAAAYSTDAKTLALRCLAALFAHPRAGASRWPLRWMVGRNDPTEFAGLPNGVKPMAAASRLPPREQLAEARENTRNAAKAVQALENAPWFDKQTKDGAERPSWRGALDMANQRYRDAMAAEQQLRVQLKEAS